MNINSAISRNKSISLKFSPLPSPIYSNDNSNRINFSILNDLQSGKRRKNSSFGEESINNNYNNLSNNKNDNIINSSNENKIKDKIKERIFSVNDINKVKKRRLTFLKKNPITFKSDKRISFSKHSANILDIFNSFKKDNKNNNISKEEISEENELKILNKELEGENEDEKEGNNEIENKKKLNINILDNNFDKVSSKIKDINIDNSENANIKQENKNINSDLNVNESKRKQEEDYIKTEKIFNSILSGQQSRRFKNEMDNFLKSRGYDISKKILNKDVYINLIKMRKKMRERNYLLEEYFIRGGNVSKKFLSPKQRKILDKNDFCLQKIEENEYRFKKILLEKNIDKDIDNFDD